MNRELFKNNELFYKADIERIIIKRNGESITRASLIETIGLDPKDQNVDRWVRELLTKIEKEIPIGSASNGPKAGYFLLRTAEDLERVNKENFKRAKSIMRRIRTSRLAYDRYWTEPNGQIKLAI